MTPAPHPYEISPPMTIEELERLVDTHQLDMGIPARLEAEIRAMAAAVLAGDAHPEGGRTWSARSGRSWLFDMQRWSLTWVPAQHVTVHAVDTPLEPSTPFYVLTVYHPDTGDEAIDRAIVEAQIRHQVRVKL